MKTLNFVLIIIFLVANAAFSQTFPAPLSPYVNDFAEVIDQATEERIAAELQTLRRETGKEMTVVTIESRARYGDTGSLEAFATALFNDWGIGDATRNDGILFLMSRDDREVRIELGAGYPPVFDDRMETTIDHTIVPFFRDGRYAEGIESGVLEIIKRADLATADEDSGLRGLFGSLRPLMLFGLTAALILLLRFRGSIQDKALSLRRCPNCGQRTLSATRRVLSQVDQETKGLEERTIRCANCDYHDQTRRSLPRRQSSNSSGSFGGGRSSGGGASGRW